MSVVQILSAFIGFDPRPNARLRQVNFAGMLLPICKARTEAFRVSGGLNASRIQVLQATITEHIARRYSFFAILAISGKYTQNPLFPCFRGNSCPATYFIDGVCKYGVRRNYLINVIKICRGEFCILTTGQSVIKRPFSSEMLMGRLFTFYLPDP